MMHGMIPIFPHSHSTRTPLNVSIIALPDTPLPNSPHDRRDGGRVCPITFFSDCKKCNNFQNLTQRETTATNLWFVPEPASVEKVAEAEENAMFFKSSTIVSFETRPDRVSKRKYLFFVFTNLEKLIFCKFKADSKLFCLI